MLQNKRFWLTFILVTSVMICHQLSGSSSLMFNNLTLFFMVGTGSLTADQMCLVCAAVQVTASLLAVYLIGRLGRRKLLTISFALMGLFLILLAWFLQAAKESEALKLRYYWLPSTCIILYLGSYSLGVGPVTWSLLADSFPIELRIVAASLIGGIGWFSCLALNLQLGQLLTNLELHGTLWLFAAFCCLGAIVAGIFVRESSGRSLADVQDNFRIS